MTERELTKIIEAVDTVQAIGHGSVEVIVKDGKILDVIKTIRERIN